MEIVVLVGLLIFNIRCFVLKEDVIDKKMLILLDCLVLLCIFVSISKL